MKKMLIALLLALTLLVSAVPSFAEEAPKELKFVYIDGWSSVDDGDTTSAITQKIAEETGVLISPVTAGGDRGTILLSSGEVGDCLMVYNATMLKTCVENGMMLDLSTLVSEEKTPPSCPTRTAFRWRRCSPKPTTAATTSCPCSAAARARR